MAPAFLRAEPHNDKPDAAIQCAAYRSWHRRFGAELVYTAGVICEFAVGCPPVNEESALELAVEHYLFCPDRLNQRCPDDDFDPPFPPTLEAYAAALMTSTVWYFWWD
jgi:hypothetical protein